jgi:hypothetical protein
MIVKPVAFPPGCARLLTKPLPTGSATIENDRDRARLLKHRRGRRRVLRNDEIRLQGNKFLRRLLSPFSVVERAPTDIDSDVAPFGPPKLLETISKCS